MGGFAGGDEAGYWDVETLKVSTNPPAVKNIGTRATIELLDSTYCIKAYAKHTHVQDNKIHWLRSSELYDTICFVPCRCNAFTVEGSDDQDLDSIYRSYQVLCDTVNEPELEEFFQSHKVVITKCIPHQHDLGGNASNIASFLRLAKEVCNLILSTDELVEIAASIESDSPFFIYNYSAVIVSEDGEIIDVLE